MDYQALAQMALEMIAENGTAMTLRVITPGDYDPGEGSGGDPTMVDHPCRGLVLPASRGTIEAFDNRFEEGALVEERLRSVKLAAHGLGVTPQSGHELIIDGETWKVLGSTPLAPDGRTAIIHTLGIKR